MDSYTYTLKLELDTSGVDKELDKIKTKLPNFNTNLGKGLNKISALFVELQPILVSVKAGVIALTSAFVAYGTALAGVATGLNYVLKWGDKLNKSNNLYNAVFSDIKEGADNAINSLSAFTNLDIGVVKGQLTEVSDLMSAVADTSVDKLNLGMDIIKQASVLSMQYGVTMKEAEHILAKAYTGETEALTRLGIKVVQGSKEFKQAVKDVLASSSMTEKQAKAYVIRSEVWRQSTSAMKAYNKNLASITTTINNFYANAIYKLQVFAQKFTNAFNGSEAGKLFIDIMGEIENAWDGMNNSIGDSVITGTLEIIYNLFKPFPAIIKQATDSVDSFINSFDFSAVADMVGTASDFMVTLGDTIFQSARVIIDVLIPAVEALYIILKPAIDSVIMVLKIINLSLSGIAKLVEWVNSLAMIVKELTSSYASLFAMMMKGNDVGKYIIDSFNSVTAYLNKWGDWFTSKWNSWFGDDKPIKKEIKIDTAEIDEPIKKINHAIEKINIGSDLNKGVQYGTSEAISMSSTVLYRNETDDKNMKYNKSTAENTKELVELVKRGGSGTITGASTVDIFA